MSIKIDMNSKVSIIIPTFNRKGLVCEAIASIYEQTMQNFELIVVDDGSTDGTREAVQNTYPDVHYLFQKNSGVSSARNLGMKHAAGEWFAFLDADDLWTPQKLEIQLEAMAQHNSLVSYTNEIWYRNGKRVNPKKKHSKYSGDIFRYCLPLCIISASSIVIHRSVIKEVGLFDETLPACEDYDLWLRISQRYPVLYLENVCIIKRNGMDSLHLSQAFWGLDRFRIKSLEKISRENSLKFDQKYWLKDELARKRHIFDKGAQKRNKSRGMASH